MVLGVQKQRHFFDPRCKTGVLRAAETDQHVLSQQFEELSVQNAALRRYQAILADMCSAGGLAAVLLNRMQQCGLGGTCPAVEHLMACSVDVPDGPTLHPLLQPPAPGASKQLVAAVLNHPVSVHAPLHTTLLQGQPLSFLHTCLLCLCNDSSLQADAADGHSNLRYEANESFAVHLAAITAANGTGAAEALALHGLAEHLIMSCSEVTGALLADPVLFWQRVMAPTHQGLVAVNKVPETVLDRVTEVMQLSEHQREQLVQAQQVFRQLEERYQAERAQLTAELQALLQRACTPEAPSSPQGLAQTAAAAAVRGSPPVETVLPQRTNGNAGSSSNGTTGGAHSLLSPFLRQAASGPQLLEAMGSLDEPEHQRFTALLEKFLAVTHKVAWLDWCLVFYGLGQLTWVQVAQMCVAMYPYRTATLQWLRHFLQKEAIDRMFRGLDGQPHAAGGAGGGTRLHWGHM